MKGRWTDTPELAYLSPSEKIVKLLYPEPISIVAGEKQDLDVVVRQEGDPYAYGWNNEAYANEWKTAQYRLAAGTYKLRVTVNTQNGISFRHTFFLAVGENIETTFFHEKHKLYL